MSRTNELVVLLKRHVNLLVTAEAAAAFAAAADATAATDDWE
jgi:hypothetical protein